MYTRNEKIVPVYIEEEVKDSYLNYSMSVIVGRALPDVRDGLKPAHRRILYAMQELNLEHSKAYKKCARIVGEVLGKYHPHGDVAVYDTLVRMAQDFSLRYPLVDGQGNFGSVDGDAAAAMRYTEARLSAISDEMLKDIDKDTVKFGPNFDASLKEPLLLPCVLPNLLVNGSSGIAVGMATNIPPHNLNEVVDAIIYLIDNVDAEIKDLMRFIKGPDFPTGGIICGRGGIKDAYTTGRGKIYVRAKAVIERQKGGKDLIIVTEIPYQVQKASLIESIAGMVEDKKIEGISDIRDESDKDGMRIVFELKRDAEAQIVLNQLFKHSQLEGTFGIIMLALVDNRPKVLNLRQILECYIGHRKVVIRRRTQFELDKALKRAHILEGLKIALKFIDRIIKVIKSSKSTLAAKENLIKEFDLSEIQAQAILEMQLQRLTALEQDKIDAEYAELLKKIELCRAILASEKKIEGIIKEELAGVKKKFGDQRRTDIVGEVEELDIEDLIAEEDVVVTISHSGYIKRLPVSSYRKQKRGGKGSTGAELREEDFSEHLFVASTKDYLLVFTDKGKVYWLKVYEIPQAGRISKGKAIINLLQLSSGENVSATIPVKDFLGDRSLVMATKEGLIKKTRLDEYSNPRKGGIIGITLEKDDELIGVSLTDGKQDLLLATRFGKAIRFSETQVRDMGRGAKGVRGIKLAQKDQVIAMETPQKDSTILTVTEFGFAKRTPASQYRIQSRGGKGIINIKVTKKNGSAVSLKTVSDNDGLMVITQTGMYLRCPIKDIRATGRSAQGVRLIKLKDKDAVATVAELIAEEEEPMSPSSSLV
ncbi:MAG: DNA gyrase subunit A [Candidatus Omnitrophota bacterium]